MTTSTGHPEWAERLSDFLDGGLEPAEHSRVEAHLEGCGDCRRVLEDLREVKSRAAALGPVEPSRDLWAGIAATIQANPGPAADEGARVIALPTAEAPGREASSPRRVADALPRDGARRSGPRRVSLSAGQLAAASVALVAASALVTWTARPVPDAASRDAAAADVQESVIAPVARVASPPPALAAELAALERAVAEARGSIDPNTARVLERNLGIIEQAIADSRRALAQDPDNDFLAEHLQRVYERKLEFLRDAARVAEWTE